jgi:putative membrane-bound dehydrogenase-like protein
MIRQHEVGNTRDEPVVMDCRTCHRRYSGQEEDIAKEHPTATNRRDFLKQAGAGLDQAAGSVVDCAAVSRSHWDTPVPAIRRFTTALDFRSPFSADPHPGADFPCAARLQQTQFSVFASVAAPFSLENAMRERQGLWMRWSERVVGWFTAGPAALVARIACLLGLLAPAVSLSPAQDARQGVTEIRQGGYVEKVDPKVDYRDRLVRVPPRSPQDSLAAFHLVPGLRLEQVAAEPLVCSCVDLAFDENGRLYVAEMIPYAENNSAAFGSPKGRVVMLEDFDGDGKFDRSTVYAEGLVWPTGLACFDGGVFVAAAPDLWYFKDTRRDGKADVREIVLTGFSTANPAAVPNSLRWRPDNRLHGMCSQSGGNLVAVRWAAGAPGRPATPISARGRDWSIHPRTGQLRLEGGGSQYGMTYDEWGRKFESSNSAPIEMVMYEDRYIARNPFLSAPSARIPIWNYGMDLFKISPPEAWRVIRQEMRKKGVFTGQVEAGGRPGGYFTAACGLFAYTGDAWPEEYRRQAFVCEGANNLVHRMKLSEDGVAMKAERIDRNCEFLASEEVWFKPIQFCSAPDGTLYLADMYREVFEHPDAIPPSAKKHLNLQSGADRGRIYRFVPPGFKQPPPVRVGKLATEELVAYLAHPNGWHRETAGRLLFERQDPAAVAPLVKQAEASSPLGRMHALYTLDGLGRLTPKVLLPRLSDAHPRVREHAVRLAEGVLRESPEVRQRLCAMAGDDDVRVRYQLAFTLGETTGQETTAALARIAARDGGDRWIRLAVLSSCYGRAGELLAALAADRQWRASPNARSLLEQLAEQAGMQNRDAQSVLVIRMLESLGADEAGLARSVVRGLCGGLSKAGSPLRDKLLSAPGKIRDVLKDLVQRARTTALDPKQPIRHRIEAIQSLPLAPYSEVGSAFPELLAGAQPKDVAMAALVSLGRFTEPDAARTVVAAWLGLSPALRGEASEILFARRPWIEILLAAVEDKRIGLGQIDPARVQVLLKHSDTAIRARAQAQFIGQQLSRRPDVIAAYRDVLKTKGDPARGKAVFKQNCGTCHRLEEVGYDLGLPLGNIQAKGAEFILVNVLDPNLQVLPEYLNYVVITKDGRQFSGMIASETATSITLRRAEGQSDSILRANIDEMVSSGNSIMPEGLEQQVSKAQMADLIAYLMSLK